MLAWILWRALHGCTEWCTCCAIYKRTSTTLVWSASSHPSHSFNEEAGPDEVPVKLLKESGDNAVTRMRKICVELWETGEWPGEWISSMFIPLPKKEDFKQCKNYRTIALVSHASKILIRIILKRIRKKTETETAVEQDGFRKGRGTRDQICNLRILMEKAQKHQ